MLKRQSGRGRAFFIALLFVASVPVAAQQPTVDADVLPSLEDIFASSQFYQKPFAGGRWAEDGPVIIYIDVADGATHVVSYNLETDQRSILVDGSKLNAGDVERSIQIEGYEYSSDGNKMLLYTDSERVWRLNTKGYYYVYDLNTGDLQPLSDRDKGFQMFAKFSPDGKQVGFVRDRNLFLVDLSAMQERQLTHDGAEGTIINGTSDWVYEEEFGLRDGWSWSPDSRYIAFIQMDETRTRAYELSDLRGLYPEVQTFRYPKAGEANSEIHVGVIDVGSMETGFFDTGTWNAGGDSLEYIPQMGWTPEIEGFYNVWMFRMDRDQNDLDLLYGNPADLSVRIVLQEREKTWIDVETGFNDLNVGNLTYLDDGRHFVWISERDGGRHLYLYQNNGTFVQRLTSGDWDVTDFYGVDEESGVVYFNGTLDGPQERHLYKTPLSVAMRETNGHFGMPEKITDRPGWHQIDMSRDHKFYIDTYSSVTTPMVVSLHRASGELVKVLEDNAELQSRLAQYDLPVPEFISVPAADGTPLNAYIIKPRNFSPDTQYPLLIHTYGGPGSQEVGNQWGGAEQIWHRLLAEKYGILVVGVDGRGTGARGKAFKSITYKRLGQVEAEDQIAAAKYFGAQSYIDPARIGIWGWSYGGYLTLMSMLYGEGPETFHAGIAVAPVTDWRQYDTIYTERYMSTPQRNAEGYRASAPVNYADRLAEDQKLLIIHGAADDNVHLQNTIQMVDALQRENKQFSMMVYPGRDHGIYGGLTRLHLYTLITDFLVANL